MKRYDYSDNPFDRGLYENPDGGYVHWCDIEPLLRECREALKFVPLRWNEKQREALVAKLTALLGDTDEA